MLEEIEKIIINEDVYLHNLRKANSFEYSDDYFDGYEDCLNAIRDNIRELSKEAK